MTASQFSPQPGPLHPSFGPSSIFIFTFAIVLVPQSVRASEDLKYQLNARVFSTSRFLRRTARCRSPKSLASRMGPVMVVPSRELPENELVVKFQKGSQNRHEMSLRWYVFITRASRCLAPPMTN
ncbi:hypothetical protein H4582DRAFT_1953333 [Lactarius indigo]|nr:hypothetical protein H4582DRAFT_1953333 [Lactarius indigo]